MGTVVIDSNIAVASVMPTPYSVQAAAMLRRWFEEEIDIIAPALWEYEITSAIRKYVAGGFISQEDAVEILDKIFSLEVTILAQSVEGHKAALAWAERIGQRIAYDAQYLALAEQLQAELWTADRRLVDAARQAGADWVHWLGEGD